MRILREHRLVTAHHNRGETAGNDLCVLCGATGPFRRIAGPMGKGYRLCSECRLIFMEREFLPGPEQEKQRYMAHRNGPDQPGYLLFLNQAIQPALPHLSERMHGLDYGCGPVPTLSVILRSHGLQCHDYDPLFFPEIPTGRFDFIFATEVLEHLFHPGEELARIAGLLNPGGIFAAMTEPWTDTDTFLRWSYAQDFTHVCFYHEDTMAHIRTTHGFELLDHANPRVWVMKKIFSADGTD
ncbi:MAG TPA: class I SAM-dependent methyltransferase [Candidatus Sumerlaeota bacterium]|nr:class I SAM-dependent methyltransferase [Candidatus Sumerlaeota bacterium]